MKNLYKRISVGVLSAALLIGGSVIAQGGQAFADSNEHKCSYESSIGDVERYAKQNLMFFNDDKSESNFKVLKEWGSRYNYEVEKVRYNYNIKRKCYKEVYDFINCLIQHKNGGEDLKGESLYIQIGLDIFKIVFNQ